MERYLDESRYGRRVISFMFFHRKNDEGRWVSLPMHLDDILHGLDWYMLVPNNRFPVPDHPKVTAISDHPCYYYRFHDGRELHGKPAEVLYLGKRVRFKFPDGTMDERTPFRFIMPDGIFRAPANRFEIEMSNTYRSTAFAKYEQK